jgi:hypothetical protein
MKKIRKAPAMKILQPGEHSEFWDTILRMRDDNDPRWMNFSSAMRYSAEAYELNLKASADKAA